MSSTSMRWRSRALAAAAILFATGAQTPALAGSDNSTDTYAGDITAIGLPAGTFIVLDYTGWRHGDAYIQNSNNIFSKGPIPQPTHMNSDVSLFTDITRVIYFTSIFDRPLVLEAAIPFVDVDRVRLGNFNGFSGGPQTYRDGFGDAVLFFTVGLIVEPKVERFLGISNYFFIPTDNYR